MFCTFCHKFENWQWPPFLGRVNFWGNLGRVVCLHTQRNGRHFWPVKYSLKLGKASLHRYHVGQKVCQIRSIWHGFRDTSIIVFCDFCEEFEKFKMAPIFWQVKYTLKLGKVVFTDTLWVKQKSENSKWQPQIFENWVSYSKEVPCASKRSSKSLYLAWFSRYKDLCVLHFWKKFEN